MKNLKKMSAIKQVFFEKIFFSTYRYYLKNFYTFAKQLRSGVQRCY